MEMEAQLITPKNMASGFCSYKPPPPTIFSNGIWDSHFLEHPMPLLELRFLSVFFLHYLLRFLHNNYINLPWLVIHALVGMILGHVWRTWEGLFSKMILNDEAETLVITISVVGNALFTFLTGVKMDPKMIQKSGKVAWTMGSLTVFFPILIATPLTRLLADYYPNHRLGLTFFTSSQAFIPFPVISCLLTDLRIITSDLGRAASAAALVSYLLSYAFFTLEVFVATATQISVLVVLKSLVLTAAFVASITHLLRPATVWIVKRTPEGHPVKESYVVCLVAAAMLAAVATDFVGLDYMTGPFIFGLFVPDGPPLGSTLVDRLDTLVSGLVVPLLMTYAGYLIDLASAAFELGFVLGLLGLVLVCFAGRIAAGLVTARSCNIPYKDAFTLSVILSARGVVDMSLFQACINQNQMDDTFFSVAAILVLVNATVVPLGVRCLYDTGKKYGGYQKKNILHTEKGAEIRVLACVFRQDDAVSTVKLLEAYDPSAESLLSVDVVHLVELLGRAAPLLIDHQLGQKQSSRGVGSQPIIDRFARFKTQAGPSAAVNVFTVVSPYPFMHHDICSLAFDKTSVLILLPFHRKWTAAGAIILDDTALRSINSQVLEKAPCSVAILVDRWKIDSSRLPPPNKGRSGKRTHRVAVLFCGGDDDREALVLSKRMARSPRVHLTVVRLAAAPEEGATDEDQWERMLDSETLKDVKLLSGTAGSNVSYRERKVTEGSETATLIRSLVSQFDLIIVGRRHETDSAFTSGLEQWSEFPELGVIGDFLASSDVKGAASALVVQQQLLGV